MIKKFLKFALTVFVVVLLFLFVPFGYPGKDEDAVVAAANAMFDSMRAADESGYLKPVFKKYLHEYANGGEFVRGDRGCCSTLRYLPPGYWNFANELRELDGFPYVSIQACRSVLVYIKFPMQQVGNGDDFIMRNCGDGWVRVDD
ncbi:hypothetical protein [Chitinolyticbacter albus]|uniref:hypothetical protein n=1 Tax=Chitinolyticbacter albus TaxID=2961951 RepID=UPI00210AA29D|nr:hypothetical protein [Chitinolyticbacter albus]